MLWNSLHTSWESCNSYINIMSVQENHCFCWDLKKYDSSVTCGCRCEEHDSSGTLNHESSWPSFGAGGKQNETDPNPMYWTWRRQPSSLPGPQLAWYIQVLLVPESGFLACTCDIIQIKLCWKIIHYAVYLLDLGSLNFCLCTLTQDTLITSEARCKLFVTRNA